MITYRRAEHLSWQNLGDETIILDSRVHKEEHELNGVGSFLWNQIDGKKTDLELAQLVCSEYDLAEKESLADTQEFLQNLSLKSLIIS